MLVGDATYTEARAGQGFSFDGQGDAVRIGNPANLQLQDFTIETWVKRDSSTRTSREDLNGFGNLIAYGENGYALGMLDSGYFYISKVFRGHQILNPDRPITDTNFHHITVVKSGSSVTGYLDGQPQATVTFAYGTFDFTTVLSIGRSEEGGASFLGVIDEMAIYNRALSSEEVLTAYETPAPNQDPAIVQFARSQVAEELSRVELNVSAAGSAPFSYQWRRNGEPISGATDSSLVFDPVVLSNAGSYSVQVTNDKGNVLSRVAELKVIPKGVMPPGLVGWWPGDGDATDKVFHNDGRLVGDAKYVTGRFGQAFSFDGAGDEVLIGNPTCLQLQDFTIAVWMRRGNTARTSGEDFNGFGNLVSYGEGGYSLGIQNDGRAYLSKVYYGHEYINPARPITDTNFHHIAVTKCGSTIVGYIDGVPQGSTTFPYGFSFTTPIAIGRSDEAGASFLGDIDEVAIYNRPLNSNEIQSVFRQCAGFMAPVITHGPQSQVVFQGARAELSVTATGSEPLMYQWQRNGTPVTGATDSSWVINSFAMENAGTYSVQVTNLAGVVVSSDAVLTLGSNNPGPANLVSRWTADGHALDQVGTNHGTLQGDTSYTTGRLGQAFSLDGTGDAVRIGNPVNLQLQDFTITAWIKRSSTSAVSVEDPINFGNIVAYGDGGYALGIKPDGRFYLSKVFYGHQYLNPDHPITDTNFHFVAVTKCGTNVIGYLDGVPQATVAFAFDYFSFTTGLCIGRTEVGGSGFLGAIDEVSIYSGALTAAEISSAYQAQCVGLAPVILAISGSQMVDVNTRAEFSVRAVGEAPLSYQWRLDGNTIAGATNSVLVLNDAAWKDAGKYSVLVSNGAGTALSADVVLTVVPAGVVGFGLVSHWNANDDCMDSEGGNHGTLAGDTTYTKGRKGKAFSFDGTGDEVFIGNPTNLQLQDFTIAAWIKRDSVDAVSHEDPNDFGNLVAYGDGGYALGIKTDGRVYLSKVFYGHQYLNPDQPITDTEFHYVAVTKSGSNVVGYLDGLPQATFQFAFGSFSFTTPVSIGRSHEAGASFLGAIDEVSIYSRPLTSNEIRVAYHAAAVGLPPSIVDGPKSQVVNKEERAQMRVTSTGSELNYQWKKNGTDIAGATQETLLFAQAASADTGSYSVQVSNPAGIAMAQAQLTVTESRCAPPTITQEPASQTAYPQAPVTLAATVAGTGPFDWQWYQNGTLLVGATNSVYMRTSVQSSDSGSYYVVVTNPYGSASSSSAVLTVLSGIPVFSKQPENVRTCKGQPAAFAGTVEGPGPIVYQWYRGATKIPAATNANYRLAAASAADNGATFVLLASSPYGSARSTPAQLTIVPSVDPGVILPAAQTVVQWTTNVLAAITNLAVPPASFQWKCDGADIAGETGTKLTVYSTQPGVHEYTLVTWNAVKTNSAKCKVNVVADTAAPVIVMNPTNPRPAIRLAQGTFSGSGMIGERGEIQRVTYQFSNVVAGVGTLSPVYDATFARTGIQTWNFTIPSSPAPSAGTNYLLVSAVDASGNNALVKKVPFFYKVETPFTFTVSGDGGGAVALLPSPTVLGEKTVIFNAANWPAKTPFTTNLYLGQSYRMLVIPNAYSWMSNWSGRVETNNANVFFEVTNETSIVLQIGTNKFAEGIWGRYNGLFEASDPTNAFEQSGAISALSIDKAGGVVGRIYNAGTNMIFRGKFGREQTLTTNVIFDDRELQVSLAVDFTNPTCGIVRGSVADEVAGWTSPLVAYAENRFTAPAYAKSRFSVILPYPAGAPVEQPGGYGGIVFGLNAASNGVAVVGGGMLGDALPLTSYAMSAFKPSKDGLLPFYLDLYKHQGVLIGWVSLDTNLNNQLVWIKKAGHTNYLDGFTNTINAVVSYFDAKRVPAITVSTGGTATFGFGHLLEPETAKVHTVGNNFVIESGSQTSPLGLRSLTVSATSGAMSGTLTNSSRAVYPIFGTVDQLENSAYGVWAAPNGQTGYIQVR